jgi:hypothetical protein
MSIIETAYKLEVKRLFVEIKKASLLLSDYLSKTPKNDAYFKGACFIDHTKNYDVMGYDDLIIHTSIFSTYKLKIDQDAKSPIRLPSVWQFKDRHQQALSELVGRINLLKERLSNLNSEMKNSLPIGRSNHLWQEMIPSVSILQVLRKIVLITDPLSYIGLTYLCKPVVKKLSLDDAQSFLNEKSGKKPCDVPVEVWLNELDKAKADLATIDTKEYGIRLARKGALRPMVNCKIIAGRELQVMASLPVIVTTSTFYNIGMPLKANIIPRKKRSDRKIQLADNSLFGLYAMKL